MSRSLALVRYGIVSLNTVRETNLVKERVTKIQEDNEVGFIAANEHQVKPMEEAVSHHTRAVAGRWTCRCLTHMGWSPPILALSHPKVSVVDVLNGIDTVTSACRLLATALVSTEASAENPLGKSLEVLTSYN
jgi:hypothetical protein